MGEVMGEFAVTAAGVDILERGPIHCGVYNIDLLLRPRPRAVWPMGKTCRGNVYKLCRSLSAPFPCVFGDDSHVPLGMCP